MNQRELEELIRLVATEADRDAILRHVDDGDIPRAVIETLSRSRSPDLRSWAIDMAARLPTGEATRVLVGVVRRSRDSDDRIDAVRHLRTIDPDATLALAPRIRRWFTASDFYERQLAMQTALAIGDLDSLPLLDQIAARDPHASGRIAGVCAMGLRGDIQGLRDRLLGHDEHFDTPWLTQALAIIQTPAALEALADSAAGLPDEECRAFAADALRD